MVIVYTKDNCPQCDMTKMYLDIKNISYTTLKLGVDFDLEKIKALAPNQKSFPVVFDGEVLVGGYAQLKDYFK